MSCLSCFSFRHWNWLGGLVALSPGWLFYDFLVQFLLHVSGWRGRGVICTQGNQEDCATFVSVQFIRDAELPWANLETNILFEDNFDMTPPTTFCTMTMNTGLLTSILSSLFDPSLLSSCGWRRREERWHCEYFVVDGVKLQGCYSHLLCDCLWRDRSIDCSCLYFSLFWIWKER